jgi:CMP-2-keto-3-deoxyoctulosonic acid synthetase
VVATDDERIKAAVEACGGEVSASSWVLARHRGVDRHGPMHASWMWSATEGAIRVGLEARW